VFVGSGMRLAWSIFDTPAGKFHNSHGTHNIMMSWFIGAALGALLAAVFVQRVTKNVAYVSAYPTYQTTYQPNYLPTYVPTSYSPSNWLTSLWVNCQPLAAYLTSIN